ncbi:hypothetical protein BSKO_05951 [Bryopsis sp. KO-2023]|nr:hypothetical protein BSKO_05951 [Bryopsis sp. KO-2023]
MDGCCQAEPEDPALSRSFRGHHDGVTSVAFHTNMKQLISGSLDGLVMLWNFKPQLRALRFMGHKGAVHSVAFSSTSALIASGSQDRTVRVWQPTVEGKSTVLKGHTGTVRCVDFAPDGRSLISCSDDKTVKVWALPSQRFQFALSGHSNWVRSCGFSPDGRLAVSGGDDKAVRIWDLRTKGALRTYGNQTSVNSVRFHPDGTCVGAACRDNTIRIWDVRTDGLLQIYKEHTGAVTDVCFHPSGGFLLSSSLDTTIKVWDLREGRLFYTLHGHEGATLGLNFSPAGDFFASGGADEQVMVWKTNFDRDLQDFAMVPAAEKHCEPASRSGRLPVAVKEALSSSGRVSNGQNENKPPPTPKPGNMHVKDVTTTSPGPAFLHPGKSQKKNNVETAVETDNGRQGASSDPTLNDVLGGRNGAAKGVTLPPPLDLGSIPQPLAATLQHVIGELNVVSQTLGLVVERLTMNEDRVKRLEELLGGKDALKKHNSAATDG